MYILASIVNLASKNVEINLPAQRDCQLIVQVLHCIWIIATSIGLLGLQQYGISQNKFENISKFSFTNELEN